jgi:hypothetical protein
VAGPSFAEIALFSAVSKDHCVQLVIRLAIVGADLDEEDISIPIGKATQPILFAEFVSQIPGYRFCEMTHQPHMSLL